MNYLVKRRKYLIFVALTIIAYFIDELEFNFILSGYYIFLHLFLFLDFFGFFVEWHIKLCRLFNAKAILLEEQ